MTLLVLGLLLSTAGCGSTGSSPGSGYGAPTDDEALTTAPGPDDDEVLAGTRGEGEFFISEVSVRVAESHPVQLFLDVQGDAPTPCHSVAYDVSRAEDTISVHISTVEAEGLMCTQVLVPHEFVVPLGEAPTLPVTVDVNDGEHVQTVDG